MWVCCPDQSRMGNTLLIQFHLSRFAPDIYYLIAWRVVQGFGLSASGVVGAGCIADAFPPAVRGTAMVWLSDLSKNLNFPLSCRVGFQSQR